MKALSSFFFNKFSVIIIATIFIIPLSFYTADALQYTKTIPEESKQVHVLDLRNVTKGSSITNVQLTISMNPQFEQDCFLTLVDDVLTKIRISNSFVCEGTHTINLNQFGSWAAENNINIEKNEIGIGVSFVDNPNVSGFFVISDYSISFKEPTYFAKLVNNKVETVIVADQDYIDTIGGIWKETKLNNYTGIGFDYNPVTNKFVQPIEKEVILEK